MTGTILTTIATILWLLALTHDQYNLRNELKNLWELTRTITDELDASTDQLKRMEDDSK